MVVRRRSLGKEVIGTRRRTRKTPRNSAALEEGCGGAVVWCGAC